MTTTPSTRPAGASRSTLAMTVVLIASALLTGCTAPSSAGSATPAPTKTGYGGAAVTGPAEPGTAPEVSTTPVGRVVDLPEGTHPWGVAVADAVGKVYLSARKQDSLAVYDMADGTVTARPVPGSARMIDLAGADGPLLLPAENRATLYELALPSLEVVASAPTGKQPHQAVRVGETTFVTDEYGHAVRAIRDGATVARFPQPVQPGGITAVGDRVAAVDVSANLLFVYDAASLELVAALPAGKGPSHVVPIGGTRVAVCDVRGNAVLTYDISGTPRALGRAAVPGRAFWIEADADTGTIYTALSNTNRLAELRTDAAGAPRLVATVPTVRNPVSFGRDPATGDLYVGGYADSELQIIPDSAFD